MHRFRIGLLAIGGVVAVTCARQSAVVRPTPSQPPAAIEPASASATPEGDGRPMASAASAAPAVPTVTPGKIWCESTQCDAATQKCCIVWTQDGEHKSRCVAKPPDLTTDVCCVGGFCGGISMGHDRWCDEAADCAKGEVCCAWNAGESNWSRDVCSSDCAEEVCLPGGRCPNGNRCQAQSGEYIGQDVGRCPLQIAPPTCGSVTCKQTEACCWSSTERRSWCAEQCGDDADVVFHCTSPRQCGRHDCNVPHTGGPRLEYTCGRGGFVSSVLCGKLKDCPKHLPSLGYGKGAPTARACAHENRMPKGIKVCQYDSGP